MLIPFGVFSAAGAGGGAAAGAYELISTATGTGSSGVITFSSIPSTYKHLQIRMTVRTNRAANGDQAYLTFNSDTGSNYAYHFIRGNGTNVASGAGSSLTPASSYISMSAADNNASGEFGAGLIDILDYTNTSKNKTVRAMSGVVNASYNQIYLMSNLWLSTSAISTISISTVTGPNWVSGSRFSLYGIKG